MLILHPILFIIQSTCFCVLLSIGNNSRLPNTGLSLFFTEITCEPKVLGENELSNDVKQLSAVQSPTRDGKPDSELLSKVAANSEKQGIVRVSTGLSPGQSLETLIASSESSSLASSSPAGTATWSLRSLQAFSSIDCRYFPWASIRSWRWRWTWAAQML